MLKRLSFSATIFEPLGILAGFNLTETIWEKYEQFAISKIEESSLKLRGSLYYLKDLTPKEAKKELKSLDSIIPVLLKLRELIEPITEKEFDNFKRTAIDFFDTVHFLHSNLEEIADAHASYKLSIPTLAGDWDSKQDARWDNV